MFQPSQNTTLQNKLLTHIFYHTFFLHDELYINLDLYKFQLTESVY